MFRRRAPLRMFLVEKRKYNEGEQVSYEKRDISLVCNNYCPKYPGCNASPMENGAFLWIKKSGSRLMSPAGLSRLNGDDSSGGTPGLSRTAPPCRCRRRRRRGAPARVRQSRPPACASPTARPLAMRYDRQGFLTDAGFILLSCQDRFC